MSTKIRRALEKLHVKSGGKGTCQVVSRDLQLCLYEQGRGDGTNYLLQARFRGRTMTKVVESNRLVTKGRSPWRRSNLWRLSPETVAFYEGNLRETLRQTARKTAHKRWDEASASWLDVPRNRP